MDHLTFYPWQRSTLFKKATGAKVDERLVGNLSLTLRDGANATPPGSLAFHFMGPQDVAAVQRAVIRHMAPQPFARDVETTKQVHIEFNEVDFLWRYTPLLSPVENPPAPAPSVAKSLYPWLLLLVGTPQEMRVERNSLILLNNAVRAAYSLADSRQWAHVQYPLNSEVGICRLVSPRVLLPQTEYVAALVPVPTFDNAGQPQWGDLSAPLPCFFSWTFWTAEEGDFETLTAALKPMKIPELGRADVRYQRGDLKHTLAGRGAITSLIPPVDGVEVTESRADLANLRQLLDALGNPLFGADRDDVGRLIIGLPEYGLPWVPDAELDTRPWTATLNQDPRYRGYTGTGRWMGILEQEALVNAATEQLGAMNSAAWRIAMLACGVLASGSLWERRLPADPAQALMVLGPLLRRALSVGGTVMDRLTSGTSPLPSAVFSTAARRSLRPNTATTRYSQPGAARYDNVLNAANQCQPASTTRLPGLPHIDGIFEMAGLPRMPEAVDAKELPERMLELLAELAQQWDGRPLNLQTYVGRVFRIAQEFIGNLCENDFIAALVPLSNLRNSAAVLFHVTVRAAMLCVAHQADYGLRNDLTPEIRRELLGDGGLDLAVIITDLRDRLVEDLVPQRPKPCNPPDLNVVVTAVKTALDPRGVDAPARRRVLSTIKGLKLLTLHPPEYPLGIDYATWLMLKDHDKEWLLPGVGALPTNAVVMMQTNPAYIDAYLMGVNTEFMNEMHWRNLPIDRASTPLRMFWGTIDQKTHKRTADIIPFGAWDALSEIGDNQHQTSEPGDVAGKRDLVVVVNSPLFRRYPATLVYLMTRGDSTDATLGANDKTHLEASPILDREDPSKTYYPPTFRGSITPEITFFIFNVNPDDANKFWVVFDEPPAELRFNNSEKLKKLVPTPITINPSWNSAEYAVKTIDKPTRVAIRGTDLIPQD